MQETLQKIVTEHGRIIFNGDNYTKEWVAEAEKRQLPNIRSTVESLKTIMDDDNIDVFEKHNVLSKAGLEARTEILLEAYSMQVNIEGVTVLNMAKHQILPAVIKYSEFLGNSVGAVKNAGVAADIQVGILEKVCSFMKALQDGVDSLEKAVSVTGGIEDDQPAGGYRDNVIPAMQLLRQAADELETILDLNIWLLPTYTEILFRR